MSEITGPIGPNEKKMYQQEYRHGADLFQRALDKHSKSDNPYQKDEFKDVMEKAMQVMNETAHELMRKELESQNQKIAQDYTNYKKHPDDPDTINQLKSDLDKAKRSI